MAFTVLVIDDSQAVRVRVAEILKAEPKVAAIEMAADGIEGFKKLLERPVDLVLCDLIMPNIDGFKFLGLKNSRPELKETPVIMLTGEEDVRQKVRTLEAGASDYLTKPFDNAELLARVRVHLKLKGLQNELREKNIKLEQLTRTDELTGLNNRRFFMEMLRAEFSRSQRYGSPFVYVMADIDHFKKINDVFGHVVGDKALAAVAKALGETARAQDVVGRYGGEEFAMFMPHTGLKGGEMAAERHRKQVESLQVFADTQPLHLTVSMGVVHYPRGDIERVEQLIVAADAALYRAKAAGRNRVVLADDAWADSEAAEPKAGGHVGQAAKNSA